MTELPALRLSVYVGEDDTWHGRPLTTEIVHRAHQMGLSGATVLRGVEGYGASSHIHTTRLLSLTSQLPMVVVIVDVPERVRAFLPVLAEIVPSGISVLDEVTMIRYGPPA